MTISSELLRRLEAIPDKAQGRPPFEYTPELDEAILRFYDRKPKRELAKVLGIGRDRLKERYNQLKEMQNE